MALPYATNGYAIGGVDWEGIMRGVLAKSVVNVLGDDAPRVVQELLEGQAAWALHSATSTRVRGRGPRPGWRAPVAGSVRRASRRWRASRSLTIFGWIPAVMSSAPRSLLNKGAGRLAADFAA
jgi:hypothetical protein